MDELKGTIGASRRAVHFKVPPLRGRPSPETIAKLKADHEKYHPGWKNQRDSGSK